MISIVCGTNRKEAVSKKLSRIYQNLLKAEGVESQIIDLSDLPPDFIFSALYEKAGKNELFNTIRRKMLESEKFIFVIPEYNGSFPGVLKVFIDGLKFPDTFTGKKCALVGLSSGVQGAGLALSHLTDIFNYCGMNVLALKPRLANIGQNMDMEAEKITNLLFQELVENQVRDLIKF